MANQKYIKLTRKTAVNLIRSAVPVTANLIEGGAHPDGAVIYSAHTDWLDVTCSNDWHEHNGRIRLVVADTLGGGSVCMYFDPDTLSRDYGAEAAERDDARREDREKWVQQIGRERAHKLVDEYWGGGV